MTSPTPFRPVITTQLDLELAWRQLMEPLGFSDASVWMMMIGPDDRPLPQVTEITEAEEPPPADVLTEFVAHLGALLDDLAPGGRLAFLRSRPGAGGPDVEDRAWARALLDACRTAGVCGDVVHLATDVDLVPMPYDELAASASA